VDKTAKWLQQTLAYEFQDPALLEEALTHRSAARRNNERLEFLGDAVLDFVVSDIVFQCRPEADEGDLSRLRASLVKDVHLAEVAASIGLGEHIILGSGEKKSGGHRRGSILADALEALFAAIYIDAGFAAAEKVIRGLFADLAAALPDSEELKDPKTRLQEILQSDGYPVPNYTLEKSSGQAHKPVFEVSCGIGALQSQTLGYGTTRRHAEQEAAAAMLVKLTEGQ
jgi:ribonuclease-3